MLITSRPVVNSAGTIDSFKPSPPFPLFFPFSLLFFYPPIFLPFFPVFSRNSDEIRCETFVISALAENAASLRRVALFEFGGYPNGRHQGNRVNDRSERKLIPHCVALPEPVSYSTVISIYLCCFRFIDCADRERITGVQVYKITREVLNRRRN